MLGRAGRPELIGVVHDDPAVPDIETASDAYALRFSGPVGDYLLDVQAQTVRRLLSDAAIEGGRVARCRRRPRLS